MSFSVEFYLALAVAGLDLANEQVSPKIPVWIHQLT